MFLETTFYFDTLVITRSPAAAPRRSRPLPSLFAMARLREWASSGLADRLFELAEELGGSPPLTAFGYGQQRDRLEAALHEIERTLEMGVLVAFERIPDLPAFLPAFRGEDSVSPEPMPSAFRQADSVSPEPMPPIREESPADPIREKSPAERKTWIEILLIGEDGNPVCGERYRLKLPDGRELTGTTDAAGMIRVAELPSGDCEVSFEELDQEAWERASEAP